MKKRRASSTSTPRQFVDATDASSIAMLRKLPFDFHYRYLCVGADGIEMEVRHKIVDWNKVPFIGTWRAQMLRIGKQHFAIRWNRIYLRRI